MQKAYISRFSVPQSLSTQDKLQAYLAKYADINVYDPRLFVYDVTAELQPGTTNSVVLKGDVSIDIYSSGTQTTLEALGFQVAKNSIKVLPDRQTLGTKIYANATTIAASIRKEPRANAEQMNSVALGGVLRLLRPARATDLKTADGTTTLEDKWFLAQSLEGYVGFVADSQITRSSIPVPPAGLILEPVVADVNGSKVRFPAGIYAVNLSEQSKAAPVYGLPPFRMANSKTIIKGSALPANAKVKSLRNVAFTEDDILRTLEPFFKTPYEWGAVTDNGVDCSGFTQFLYKSRGVFLPRDAEEQGTAGTIVAFGEDVIRDAQPGDLVFFMSERGKINHIAISLGNGRIIHSSGPGVHVSNLNERDNDEAEKLIERTMFARRIIRQ